MRTRTDAFLWVDSSLLCVLYLCAFIQVPRDEARGIYSFPCFEPTTSLHLITSTQEHII